MPQSQVKMNELLTRANSLPSCPGVYIMKDRHARVVYVGKSRKLKNRVSQYFQNSKKNTKTERMVRITEDFDYIVCNTEIEALSLENTLIKQYSPKYNIKLKDAKSYPYIKITREAYPKLTYTRTRSSDKARYFGPFSGTSTVFSVISMLQKSLGIPSCNRKFPRDIGKERPCMYYQIGQCCGVCTGKVSEEEYGELVRIAIEILKGNTSLAIRELTEKMEAHAEAERFEMAAKCRDTINALRRLSQKQHVVGSPDTMQDVFGIYSDDAVTCISAIYVREGAVVDKRDFVFGAEQIADSETLSAFLVEHYKMRDTIPRNIFYSFMLDCEDEASLSEYFSSSAGHKINLHQPKRGDASELCKTADENAAEAARRYKEQSRGDDSVLLGLANALSLEVLPQRIEAYDISNIGSENKTAGMIVVKDAKFSRADYRSFNIKDIEGTDDYACMKQALSRRFARLKSDSSGSFLEYPDLLLIDGGKGHVAVAREAMREAELDIPIFGMVKDDYHKTRALCTDSEEINIARDRSLFMFIYKIQDEVHKYTVGKTTDAKRRTLKRSSLENIKGIGPVKAKKLLLHFGTLGALRSADESEIASVKGVTAADAEEIVRYFENKR